METREWTILFVAATFTLYLTIAWLTRVRDTRGFYVAGRGVPAMANGMATASDWMSAASFISMAGLISFMGYAGGVYLMGWTGGYVLLALLLAPYLRKFGYFTVPDFVGDRFDSNMARLVAVLCALFISCVYVAGQMRGVGVVFSRFLEVDINTGVFFGMAIVFFYATLGGMKGITWTQVAQYWVLITAFLTAAIAIGIKLTGIPVPSFAMGGPLLPEHTGGQAVFLLERLDQISVDLGFSRYTEAFVGSWDKVNVFLVTLALHVRYGRAAARARAFLHGAERPRRALERDVGPVFHCTALPDRACHGSVRALPHDREPERINRGELAGVVSQLGADGPGPVVRRR